MACLPVWRAICLWISKTRPKPSSETAAIGSLENGEDLAGITRVPASHNVPQLWGNAKLPKLQADDYGRLVEARVYLMWAVHSGGTDGVVEKY
jgi:hypothetical protein